MKACRDVDLHVCPYMMRAGVCEGMSTWICFPVHLCAGGGIYARMQAV